MVKSANYFSEPNDVYCGQVSDYTIYTTSDSTTQQRVCYQQIYYPYTCRTTTYWDVNPVEVKPKKDIKGLIAYFYNRQK